MAYSDVHKVDLPLLPITPTPNPEYVKKDATTCDDPAPAPKKKRPATPKKKGRGKAEPKEPIQKATESKGKAAPKEPAKNVWTSAHSKFEMGKPMLSELVLATAGVNTKGLHKHYMTHASGGDTSIVGQFKAEDLHSGIGFFSVSWSDLYDVFNLDALDISLIRCLTL